MGKPTIERLEGIHAGRAGAVLGGGPSMPGQLELLPPDTVLFSVNHHAAMHPAVTPDYLVFLDPLKTPERDYSDLYRQFPGVNLSPNESDTDVLVGGMWNAGTTAQSAAWLALFFGCDPVFLVGIDCHTGDRDYWYDPPGLKSKSAYWKTQPGGGYHLTVKGALDCWRKCFQCCPISQRIRALEWPLNEIFPAWPEEKETSANA